MNTHTITNVNIITEGTCALAEKALELIGTSIALHSDVAEVDGSDGGWQTDTISLVEVNGSSRTYHLTLHDYETQFTAFGNLTVMGYMPRYGGMRNGRYIRNYEMIQVTLTANQTVTVED